MKRYFAILLPLLVLLVFGQAQAASKGLFAGGLADSVLSNGAADTVLGQTVLFDSPLRMDGHLTIAGNATVTSGTGVDIRVKVRLVHATDSLSYGQWNDLGTIGTAASSDVDFSFVASRQSWWGYCLGYQVRFEMTPSGAVTTAVTARGLSR